MLSSTAPRDAIIRTRLTKSESIDLVSPPSRISVTVKRIIRDSKLSEDLKMTYDHRCQVCNQSIWVPGKGRYAEGHHIVPLGGSHNGNDQQENMLCLCPNHHAEMDYGVFYIDSNDLTIVHYDVTNPYHGIKLSVLESHNLSKTSLNYHRDVQCSSWIEH